MAGQTFQEHGYHATGVATIAATARAPKGSFYNHFASKEALAVVVIDRYARGEGLAMLGDDLIAAPGRVRAHFALLREENRRHDFSRRCLLGNFALEAAAESEPITAAVAEAFDLWTDALAAVIA